MLYTIIGSFLGGLIGYLFAKITGLNFTSRGYLILPTSGQILVFFAALIGGSIGLGVGTVRFLSGTYSSFQEF